MSICSTILVAGALVACGGGSGGATNGVTAVASDAPATIVASDTAASAPDASVVVNAPGTATDAAQLAETTTALGNTQVMLTSLLSVGASTGSDESATDAAADTTTSAETAADSSVTGTLLLAAAAQATSVTALSASVPASYAIAVADEHHIFTVPTHTVVRFGDPSTMKWTTKTISGYGECTNEFFGKDPAVGILKVCQAVTNNAALAAAVAGPIWSKPAGAMPVVDLTKIPTPWVAYTVPRITTSGIVAPPSDIGAFRTECGTASMSFDDPIVYPGQVGKSHLHTFFGNTGANANSTPDSLRNTGRSTCTGGTANRSAYWVPTIVDTQTGAPVAPVGNGVYYKGGYDLPPSVIHPIPVGLRMIAGNSAATGPGSAGSRWVCVGGPNNENDKYGTSMGNCDVGAQLVEEIEFPQCWDGVNLDSPDHKSHMAYPANRACPSSHPVAIPQISFHVAYNVTVKGQPLHWRLSSDNYSASLPGGYSSHGDWFNGWEAAVSDTWGKDCVMAVKDCHSDLLGDGRILY